MANPNQTSHGTVLYIYGDPSWGEAKLRAWSAQAAPAVQAAVLKILSALTPDLPESEQEVSVIAGPVLLNTDYAQAEFDIFSKVPLIDLDSDPDGSLYQARSNDYATALAGLPQSTQFRDTLLAELGTNGQPAWPNMAFSPGNYAADTSGNGAAAASGEIIAIILLAILAVIIAIFICWWLCQVWKEEKDCGRFCARLRGKLCPCCRGKQQSHLLKSPSSQSAISPMQDFGDEELGRGRDSENGVRGAQDYFDQPRSPSGLGKNFFDALGSGATEANTMVKIASDAVSRSNKVTSSTKSSRVKKHKFLGTVEDRAVRKENHKQANILRIAMGGESAHHANRSGLKSQGRIASGSVTGSTVATSTWDPSTSTWVVSGTLDNSSMVHSVDSSKRTSQTSHFGRSPSVLDLHNGIGVAASPERTRRPAVEESDSSPSNSDMEVVEVTDTSSSSDEAEL